jgi:xylulokinase
VIPYFEGERSPNLPRASGAFHGVTSRNLLPANIARAAVEGLLCSMAYCMERIAGQGVRVQRVILVGGGARSAAVRQLAPAILVHRSRSPRRVSTSRGAAWQAAWVLAGTAQPPSWAASAETYTAEPTPDVFRHYRLAQGLTLGQ